MRLFDLVLQVTRLTGKEIVMYRIAQQDIITESQAEAIDHLFRDRWRALLSVDDAVVGVMDALEELQVLDNTCAP